MRAAAQVFPCGFTLAVEVVVDGQFPGTDFGSGALGRNGGCLALATLEVDQFQFIGLIRQFGTRFFFSYDAAAEGLPRLDNAAHGLIEGFEVFGGEGLFDVEVVVEAVRDGRADYLSRVSKGFLYRLGRSEEHTSELQS